MVGICCALCIYVEHNKGVKSVACGDTTDRFQRIVEIVGLGGRRIYSDGDKRFFADSTENITVFRVKIGYVEPPFAVIYRAFLARCQRLVKGENIHFLCFANGYVHNVTPRVIYYFKKVL